ncbi:hypothetical protein DDB_G0291416 [Dictyostelium discoideum AX4]|uniref:Uncharacterized protein n=1 Tax=Dictyostelium discoideum TaxID=44689 RepID=Q54EP5_DICDI|nr:hypothetical protein DDB_G0291416 [Dictyostelium discoideum AX4]EAL61692.1 hypothetical protein DDB_G0291416 [Dictyostelium discoideum AX4]|eukprot:XP_635195.1 hypothetical protein DDB_G0291416 [Dictyostelium discoideum AX4]
MENGANTGFLNHNIMIRIIKDDPSLEEDINLQRLPFSIGYNGFAKVSNYFQVTDKPATTTTTTTTTTPSPDDKKYLYSSFRGIQLIGEKIKIPNGFDGYVFRDEDEQDNNNRKWEPISKFNELTYWNRETVPSDFDKQIQAFKSLNIQSMVNKEITQEDIENEIKSGKINNQGNSKETSTSTTTTTTTTTETTTNIKTEDKIENEGNQTEVNNFKDDIDDTKDDKRTQKKSKK